MRFTTWTSKIGLLGLILLSAVSAQDEAAVEQRRLLQFVLETEQALQAANWLEAVEKFDAAWQLAVQKEDPLLLFTGTDVKQLAPGETELFAGGTARLEHLFHTARDEFRREYQRQYAEVAEQRLSAAVSQGNVVELEEQSRRFAFCPAARKGWLALAGLAADRGDALEAALILGRCQRLDSSPDLTLQVQQAICYDRAGLTDDAHDILRRLVISNSGSKLKLGTKELRIPVGESEVTTWLRDLLPQSLDQPESIDNKTTANFRHVRLQPRGPVSLQAAWSSDLFELQDVLFASELNPILASYRRPIENEAARFQQFNSIVVPTAVPISFGKSIIFRMPCGIRSVDATTGAIRWEVARPDSELRMIFDRINQRAQQDATGQLATDPTVNPFDDVIDPRLPLLIQMLRTNTASQMSLGNSTLFVCAGSSGATWNTSFGMFANEAPNVMPATNYIQAYDATTGVFQWEIGGQLRTRTSSPLGNRLSGFYFLGAPLTIGQRIYALAESGAGLFLIQVGAPRTGSPGSNPEIIASQLLTEPQFKLGQHPVRAHAGLMPSFAQGLLICPTCDGRIVAVSADDHSIRWIFRYADTLRMPEFGERTPVLSGARSSFDSTRVDLDSRWTDSLVRIAHDRVLLTQRDSDQLYCLDLLSGRELWRLPRGAFHAVAAVDDNCVVLVGNRVVAAFDLESGKQSWLTELNAGVVCGSAVASDGIVQLPMSDGTVIAIAVKTGRKLVEQSIQSVTNPGNLVATKAGLVSQSLTAVTMLHSGSEGETDVAAAKRELLDGNVADALRRLDRRVTEVPADHESRDLLIQTRLEAMRQGELTTVDELERLSALIARAESDRAIGPLLHSLVMMAPGDAAVLPSQMVGKGERFRGEYSALRLGMLPDSVNADMRHLVAEIQTLLSELPTAHDDVAVSGDLSRSQAALVIASIRSALAQRSPTEILEIESRLQPVVESLLSLLSEPESRTTMAVDLNMAGLPRLALLASRGVTSEHATLLQELMRLEIVAARESSSDVLNEQLDVWHAAGDTSAIAALIHDAEPGDVETDDAGQRKTSSLKLPFADRTQSSAAMKSWLTTHVDADRVPNVFAVDQAPAVSESDDRTMLPEQRMPAHVPNTLIPLHGAPGIFRGWSFVREMEAGDIAAFDDAGNLKWVFEVPVNTPDPGYGSSNEFYVTAVGHLLIVTLRDRLFALDAGQLADVGVMSDVEFEAANDVNAASKEAQVPSPRLVWQRDLQPSGADPEAVEFRMYDSIGERLPQYSVSQTSFFPTGPVSMLGLPVIAGRTLAMLNPLTGETNWRLDGIDPDITLLVSDDSVLLLSITAMQIEVRSMIDGRLLASPPLPTWLLDGMQSIGSSVRDIELEVGVDYPWFLQAHGRHCLVAWLTRGSSRLESRDLLTDTVSWSIALPEESVYSNVCDGTIAVLSNGDQLKLIESDSGRVLFDQKVNAVPAPRELYLRSSHGSFIVMPEAVDGPTEDLDIVLNSVRVHGRIWCLRRDDTAGAWSMAWERPVENMAIRLLNPERATILPNAPILVLVSRKSESRPGSFVKRSRHSALVLDVRNGNVLLDADDVGQTLNNHWLHIDGASRKLTLSFESRFVTFSY